MLYYDSYNEEYYLNGKPIAIRLNWWLDPSGEYFNIDSEWLIRGPIANNPCPEWWTPLMRDIDSAHHSYRCEDTHVFLRMREREKERRRNAIF